MAAAASIGELRVACRVALAIQEDKGHKGVLQSTSPGFPADSGIRLLFVWL